MKESMQTQTIKPFINDDLSSAVLAEPDSNPMQVSEEERIPFKQVNRDEGESLLGIAWFPDAPQGW